MDTRGFTLIEIILVLVLTGILAAVGGTGIVTGARSFMETREATALSQQAQLAQDRITREIVVLVDIDPSTAQRINIQNIEGNRSILYDADNREIDIISPNSDRDTLIDNVTSFSLRYFHADAPEEGSTSWPPSSGMQGRDLTAVRVSFTLASDTGGTRTFTSQVVPRNNQNTGGVIPTADIPSLSRYDFCFIATAAYGDLNHPVVAALREFRDKALMPHAPGRALVRAYYAVGPHLAGVVLDSPVLAAGVRAVLRPVAALAQLGLHAPVHLALSLLLCVALGCLLGRAVRSGRNEQAGRTENGGHAPQNGHASTTQVQRGAVLLSTIVTIVAFAVLAASAVTLMTSSTQSGYFATEGDRAYYLAEAGFNAAASMFLHAGDNASDADQARKDLLAGLSVRPYVLSGGAGSFELEAQPYWFEARSSTGATNLVGTTSLRTRVYGTLPDIPAAATGRLRIGSTSTTVYFSGVTRGTNTLTFNNIRNGSGNTGAANGLPSTVSDETDIFLSVRTNTSTSVTQEAGTLTLSSATSLANFPQYNGMFTVRGGSNSGNVAYVYRERSGNTLTNIRLADGQNADWTSLSIAANNDTDITLEAFVRLNSTGVSPGGTRRLVTYNIPIGWVAGGAFNKERFVDTFDTDVNSTASNWVTGGSAYGELGSHSTSSAIGGNNALKVDSMQLATTTPNNSSLVSWLLALLRAITSWWSDSNYWSSIFFNWTKTNINMARAWVDAGYNLSYDAQVKMYLDQSDRSKLQHFGGMLFRGEQQTIGNNANDLKALGLSFMRTYRDQYRERSCVWVLFWICDSWPSSYSAPTMSTELDTRLVPGYTSSNAPGYLFDTTSSYPLETNTSSGIVWQGIATRTERQTIRQYSHPAIVLWARENGQFRWLAYKRLHTSNLVSKAGSTSAPIYTLADWPTMMVRIAEGRELRFTNAGGGSGNKEFKYGDFVETTSSGGTTGRARVIGPPIVTNAGWNSAGVWNSGAAGRMAMTNIEGTITGNTALRVNNVERATSSNTLSASSTKYEYLRVYYGRPTSSTANRIVNDENRNGNPRLTAGNSPLWTPDDYTTWTKTQSGTNVDDNFTLVQWEGLNGFTDADSHPSEVIVTSTLGNTVLRLDNFRTQDGTTAPSEGIALVTAGTTGDRIYFDDFGLQLDLRGGQGFLPPIQQ